MRMAAPAMEGLAVSALRSVLHRVHQAAERSGRRPEYVRVVAVSKTKPVSLIQQIYDAGHRSFAENYVQEFVDKAPQLPGDIEWHFVGHLQSNKAKTLVASVPNLYMVESVDNEKIANHLDRAVANIGRTPLKVLVQVNTSGEESLLGGIPAGCVDLVKHVMIRCPNLEFSSLMTIGMVVCTFTPKKIRSPMTIFKPAITYPKPRFFSSLLNKRPSTHLERWRKATQLLPYHSSPHPTTFPTLLKTSSLHHLPLLHQQAIVLGYASDPFISSSLISSYSKSSNLVYAYKVFDSMPLPDLVPSSALIAAYAEYGHLHLAFNVFNQIQHQGIKPNSVTILGLLKGIVEARHLQCLHGWVVKNGYETDIMVANSMIHLYSRCGHVGFARILFDLMCSRDLVSWNSMISGYARDGRVGECVSVFERMRADRLVCPDHHTFGSLLLLAGDQRLVYLGRQVHKHIVMSGLECDEHICTMLMSMYLRFGSVECAYIVFDGAEHKDDVCWSAMMAGLIQHDWVEEALAICRRMMVEELMPSSACIASLLTACARLVSFLHGASVHGYVVRQRMVLDRAAKNSLVSMYAKCSHLKQCRTVFDEMQDKDVVTWNAMISGYAQDGYLHNTFSLFSQMRLSDVPPDSITFMVILQACASLGTLRWGRCIHGYMMRSEEAKPNISITTSLVDMYAKCGDLRAAQRCFRATQQHDLISWSAIIAAYGNHGKGLAALQMYSKFLNTGMKPNQVMFLSVLSACSHAGLVLNGLEVFQSMVQDHGIPPTIEHQACMADLLGKAGRVEEAMEIIKAMPIQPSVEVLGILLDACRIHRNFSLAEEIATEITRLKPEAAGSYVQLAYGYAAISRWESVGKSWRQMKSLGLRKSPAWSSVELNWGTATFFAGHASLPQYEGMILLLKILDEEMRKVDFIGNIEHDINRFIPMNQSLEAR